MVTIKLSKIFYFILRLSQCKHQLAPSPMSLSAHVCMHNIVPIQCMTSEGQVEVYMCECVCTLKD